MVPLLFLFPRRLVFSSLQRGQRIFWHEKEGEETTLPWRLSYFSALESAKAQISAHEIGTLWIRNMMPSIPKSLIIDDFQTDAVGVSVFLSQKLDQKVKNDLRLWFADVYMGCTQ